MGSLADIRFLKKHSSLILALRKELPFTKEEIETIFLVYKAAQKEGETKSQGVTKEQFQELLHTTFGVTNSEINGRIVAIVSSHFSPYISVENFARIISVFLRGTLEQKIKHCFKVYDFMLSGKIRRDVMASLLESCFNSQNTEDETDEAVKDLSEILLKKFDIDRDGLISFDDYRGTCLQRPDLIEMLGQCMPDPLAQHTLLTLLTPNPDRIKCTYV